MNDLVARLIDAAGESATFAPQALLDFSSAKGAPLADLLNGDESNAFFDAFDADFWFIIRAHMHDYELSNDELRKAGGLIRWLFDEVGHWTEANDPNRACLCSIVVVAQRLGGKRDFWSMCQTTIGLNAFTAETKRLVAKITFQISAPNVSWSRISDREAIDKFNKADDSGDWVAISETLFTTRQRLFSSTVVTQAVQFLYNFAFDELVDSVRDTRTFHSLSVVDALDTTGRLRLAAASENPYVQFCAIYSSVTDYEQPIDIEPQAASLLVDILHKVALDEDRWRAWMKIFHAHPSRYPAIQAPLGQVLANNSTAISQIYIDAIELYPLSSTFREPREQAASCFRAFKGLATPERRQEVWRQAYKRYRLWNFKSYGEHPNSISWSAFDFAICGFALECMSSLEREQRIDEILDEIKSLHLSWHASSVACVGACNALLSELQPLIYASHVITQAGDQLWLDYYIPSEEVIPPYIRFMYRFERLTNMAG